MPEHKITLADLEAVEKAGERAIARPWTLPEDSESQNTGYWWEQLPLSWNKGFEDHGDAHYATLAANHAVEMKQALTEALGVIETLERTRLKGACNCEICQDLAVFKRNWPGLMTGKEEQ